MKNPIGLLLEFFRIKKTIRYHGAMDQLELLLEKMGSKPREKEDFYLTKISDKQYALEPKISLGMPQYTINSATVRSKGIVVTIDLVRVSDQLQEIRFTGARHIAHIFIFIMAIFFLAMFVNVAIQDTILPLIVMIPSWFITHWWFNFVWTSQEKALIDEVKLALHIRIKAKKG